MKQKKQKKKDNENREIVLSRTNTDSSSISHDRSCNLDSKNEQISPLFSHMEILSNPSHQKQRSSFPEISEQMYSTSSILLPENKVDLDIIAEGARFSRHALAIYTWVLYVYMKPFCGVCSLSSIKLRDYCCTCPCSTVGNKSDDCDDLESNIYHYDHFHSGDDDLMRGKQAIIGDNYCGLHKKALLAIAALKDSELIYGQFEDGIRTTPYCIVLDHAWKSVVVSIRGTLSLEDCVVDVIVDAKPLDDLGKQWNFDGKGEYCHAGILDCTVWIMEDLISHGFLHQLLNMQYPDYTLRIVGHSLGAGCAVLLSKMLRKQYPTLRCLSYSPPGGFCTYRSATECKDFVTSYILDSDLVPRLSIENMENLRDEILTIIGQINVPKMSVLRSIFSRENTWESMLHNPNEDSEYSHQLSLFKGIQQNRKSQRNKVNVSLYPPGRIVHLIKPTDQGTPCYIPIWSENDSFHEIVVSPTMGTDHFPNKVCQELEKVARSFGLSINLGSTF